MNGTREDFPRCAVCSEPAAQVCGGCKAENYCGKLHQKQAWRAGHKKKCSPFRVAYDDVMGRHLIATRDIKQGEIILKEKPAILGPKIQSYPTCLTCYKRVLPCKGLNGKIEYYKCTACGWPMCNPDCQSSKVHREECDLMVARKYKSNISYQGDDKMEAAYCVITPLRCLLLQKSEPKQWEAVTNLEDHLAERTNTPLYRILKANVITFIQQVLGLVQFDENTIMRIVSILDTNAYDIRFSEDQIKLRGLYLTASMRAHDCVPNTKHIFSKDYVMTIVAMVPISKGSVLKTSYTQPFWSTLARRSHLMSAKCFWCTCERCKDPTELGTYLGSIYCTKCYPNNYNKDPNDIPKLLSVDPMDGAADWKCQSCDHRIPSKLIIAGNDSVKKEVSGLSQKSPKEFEEFIVKYDQLLHPRNCHIVEIKYALCQMYGHREGFTYKELNDAAIDRKISLCEELLDILDVLQPGLCQARGMLLIDLQEATIAKTKRDLAATKITKEAAHGLMGECLAMLQEASNILKSEPDVQKSLQKRLNEINLMLSE